MRIEDIINNAKHDIDVDKQLGVCSSNPCAVGQLNIYGYCDGIVRMQDAHCIYEGEYKNHKPNGYGRRIYFNGETVIGYWIDGQRQGLSRIDSLEFKRKAGISSGSMFKTPSTQNKRKLKPINSSTPYLDVKGKKNSLDGFINIKSKN